MSYYATRTYEPETRSTRTTSRPSSSRARIKMTCSRNPLRDPKPRNGLSGYRYYSPTLGRWPSRDPIGERGSLNLQQFVGNLPIGLVDINGLLIWIDPVNPGNDPPVCISCPSDPSDPETPFCDEAYAWFLLLLYTHGGAGGGFEMGDDAIDAIKNSREVNTVFNAEIGLKVRRKVKKTGDCPSSGAGTFSHIDKGIQPLGGNVGAFQLTAIAKCNWTCKEKTVEGRGCCCVCSGKCHVDYSISKTYTFREFEGGNPANCLAFGIRWAAILRNLRDTSYFMHGDWTDDFPLSFMDCPE